MWKKSVLLSFSLITVAEFGEAAGAGAGTMVSADAMQWQEMAPGSPLKIAILWGDRSKGEYAMLLKMPAGFVAPVHAHTGDYYGMNVSGTWRHSLREERNENFRLDLMSSSPGWECTATPASGLRTAFCLSTSTSRAISFRSNEVTLCWEHDATMIGSQQGDAAYKGTCYKHRRAHDRPHQGSPTSSGQSRTALPP